MGKVVEKVVAELLSDEAERGALLSDSQLGSRKKRLAINAAAIMVDRAHAAWKEDNITGVLLMDIKAGFPSIARGWLIHGMKAKKIDGYLIQWTESFPSERTVEMVIEGNVLQSHPVEAGVPLCSPVSPILFAIHTAGLIKLVEERVQAEGRIFVDDLGWVATVKDLNQVVKKLEACPAECIEWASRRDLQFDTAKTEAAIFTLRKATRSTSGRNSKPKSR
jgi:ferredoxin